MTGAFTFVTWLIAFFSSETPSLVTLLAFFAWMSTW